MGVQGWKGVRMVTERLGSSWDAAACWQPPETLGDPLPSWAGPGPPNRDGNSHFPWKAQRPNTSIWKTALEMVGRGAVYVRE